MARINYPAIKPVGNDRSKALADIKAHTNQVFSAEHFTSTSIEMANYREYYPLDKKQAKAGYDGMTVGHETTHQINSEIANAVGGRDKNVGLYCLNDVGFRIDEPRGLTISQVASKVPQDFRGGICGVYDLYLIKQAQSWGDRPLYLADEWVAYTNGATVALELAAAGDGATDRWSELQNAVYFNMFLCVERSLIGVNAEIDEMISFQLMRVGMLQQECTKYPQLDRPETTALLNKFYDSEFFKPFENHVDPDKLPDWGSAEYL